MSMIRTRNPYVTALLWPSSTITATTAGSTIDGFGQAIALRAQLEVTAASGTTPTLDVVIQDSLDGTNWNTIGTFAQKTTTGREVINITAQFADKVRVVATVGGTTPSFTFSVKAVSRWGED